MSHDADVVAAVQAIVDGAEEADQILLGTIALLAERYDAGVGLRFVEAGVFSDGPWAGPPSRPSPGWSGTTASSAGTSAARTGSRRS